MVNPSLLGRLFSAGALLTLAISAESFAQADGIDWTANLLSNPGAEAGTLAGWSTDDPVVVKASQSQSSQSGLVTPYSGNWFFNMAAAPAAPSGQTIIKRLYQDIDVSSYADAISNGQAHASVAVHYQTEDRPNLEGSDYAWLVIHFVRGDGTTIDRWTASRLQSPNLAWVQARLEGTVPTATARIRVELQGEKFETMYVNAFFDNAQLLLGVAKTEVSIDLKPSDTSNSVAPNSQGRVWVAILGDAQIDGSVVDPLSVRLGPSAAMPEGFRYFNVNHDGYTDLVARFRISETGIACGDSDVSLTANTYEGEQLFGKDSIVTRGCR